MSLIGRFLATSRPWLRPKSINNYYYRINGSRRLLSSFYNDNDYRNRAPPRARRDLYEEDQPEPEEDYNYEESSPFKAWLHRHRKSLIRVGAFGGAAGSFYIYHLEEAPITRRRRFMNMSPKQETYLADASFEQIMQEYKHALLPPNHSLVRYVEKVAEKIVAAVEDRFPDQRNAQWQVFIINAPTANAFVLPGGQIFVFRGLLSVAENEAGLATILCHEIAHKLARHSAEKMSYYQFFNLAALIGRFVLTGEIGTSPIEGIMRDLLLFLPFSRKCETEADYIGLLLMAKACYDPRESVNLWRRMQEYADRQSEQGARSGVVQPPTFLSTHPSNTKRIEKLQEWMPEAVRVYEESGCLDMRRFWSLM